MLQASVNDNLGFATLASTSRAGLVDFAGQRKRATAVAEKLQVRMHDINQEVGSLSGGNQQKIVFGRSIMADSKFSCWMSRRAAWMWEQRSRSTS